MIQSAPFWVVLAIAVPVFWTLPVRARLPFLTLVSLGYLASVDLWSVGVLAVWTLLFYGLVDRGSARMRGGLVVALLGYLIAVKYALPRLLTHEGLSVGERILVPLGVSYYTFKLINYAVAVGRGTVPRGSFSQLSAYLFLFPIFSAGPIERWDHFANQRPDRFAREDLVVGLTRIAHGLIKKLVIGDILISHLYGPLDGFPAVLNHFGQLSMLEAWRFVIVSYLYAYMDFSAYSDIAIGASRLFGLRILENFNVPVIARNIGDFWKRWHMTLAGWCQTHVYLPMIGWTRNPYAAVYATFLVMGLWHAGTLTWVCWGLYHGTATAVHLTWGRFKRRRRWSPGGALPARIVSTAATFLFIASSMCFPTSHGHGDAGDALALLGRLFGISIT